MDIVDPAIDRYLHDFANPDDPVLREMEVLAAERSFPIVGPQVGRLLHLLTRAVGGRRVIELGSGFGYSAYWFAHAVGPAGRVVMSEFSQDNADLADDFLRRGGVRDRVDIHVGDAFEILAGVGGEFDVVFNDIDKERYGEVPELAAAALRPGGLLISDNMLWYGSVLDADSSQASTRGVQAMTRLLHESDDFETVLLPLRDGLSVSIYGAGDRGP